MFESVGVPSDRGWFADMERFTVQGQCLKAYGSR